MSIALAPDAAPTPPTEALLSGPLPSGPLAREAIALAAFDHVVARAPGYRARPGQREMAAHIAHTLSGVTPGDGAVSGDAALPARGIAVVQAGTGVGKSAAYASTVIPLALAQQKRVIISTATVALQEQLMAKDLPALAAVLPQPFSFALAKGRGRYVCRLKLDQLSGGDAASADMFEGDESAPSADASARWKERGVQYTRWANELDGGTWDGDRDRLDDPPEGGLWGPVAAERHSCTARHCPSYNSCSYYQARAKLAQAQVIVVNHDLLLSTLGLHALPAPQDCYVVFDEAHHLPGVAQGQFTASMDLMNGRWLDRLPRAVEEVAGALEHKSTADVASLAKELKSAQTELARLGMQRMGALPAWNELTGRAAARTPPRSGGFNDVGAPVVDRFESGQLPTGWHETVEKLHANASALLKVFEALATQPQGQRARQPRRRCALRQALQPPGRARAAPAERAGNGIAVEAGQQRRPAAAGQVAGSRCEPRPGHPHRARLPVATRQPAAQPPLEPGARGGGHLGLARHLRQLRSLPGRVRAGVRRRRWPRGKCRARSTTRVKAAWWWCRRRPTRSTWTPTRARCSPR